MTIKAFLNTFKETSQAQGVQTAAKFGLKELQLKLSQTDDAAYRMEYPHQQAKLDQALESDNQVWIFWFDGGRVDYFSKLASQYFDGNLEAVYNGGIGYSGDWADRHLRRSDLSQMGLFSVNPVRSLSGTDFDGRDYFKAAPDIDPDTAVEKQLAALGYRELKDDGSVVEISPYKCNQAVREHMTDIKGGIIRYLKPHPPFEGIEDITAGSQKTRKTWHSLWGGEITKRELVQAYIDTYRVAFEAAVDLYEQLDGDVYITADHGECLGDCNQLYHGSNHAKHEHLCVVPWFRVDDLRDGVEVE